MSRRSCMLIPLISMVSIPSDSCISSPTWDKFHDEASYLRKTFIKNSYPGFFIDKCIKLFLDKIFIAKKAVLTVPQKELSICLPFLGKQSLELKSKLQEFVYKYYP